MPSLLSTDEEKKSEDEDDVIFVDDSLNFTVSPPEEKGKREITFNFFHRINSPRKLESKEGDARLWFLSPENYDKLLTAYREFKKNRK